MNLTYSATAQEVHASRIGMGTHVPSGRLLSIDQLQAAVRLAYDLGVRSFDTAHSYANGQSERCLGRVIGPLDPGMGSPKVQTKIGFPDIDLGADSAAAVKLLRHRYPAVVGSLNPLLERGGHCLDLEFLNAAVQESIHRLAPLKPFRVLIHNPETQLLGDNRTQVSQRLQSAFELLEGLTQSGTIGGYGIATWQGLCVPQKHPLHLSLNELCELAQSANGGQSGFKTVMLPLNTKMKAGADLPTQLVNGRLLPAIVAAYELGLEVQVSSPLSQGDLVTSADVKFGLSFALSHPYVSSAFVTMWSSIHIRANLGFANSLAPANH